MANIGDQLNQPEPGWRRFDDIVPQIKRMGVWNFETSQTYYYGGSVYLTYDANAELSFKFYGTSLRLIVNRWINKPDNIPVEIDGVPAGTFSCYTPSQTNTALQYRILAYEITGLEETEHTVVIKTPSGMPSNQNWNIDAIDIDDTGYLVTHTQVGSQLTAPEPGWRRYDDRQVPIIAVGGTVNYSPTIGAYNTTETYFSDAIGKKIKFDFIGSKIRIIAVLSTLKSNDLKVTIDGVEYPYTQYSSITVFQGLSFEKTGLTFGRHSVSIEGYSAGHMGIDAIDIDDTGRLLHPDEVIDVRDLEVGKRIRCHYQASIGQVGVFSGLGQETSDFIPAASTATPDGDFYFIAVNTERWWGRWKLIADRNVQHSISWDALNSSGLVNGVGLGYDVTKPLVAGWRFDEGGGGTVYDVGGRYNGTVSGATFVTGWDGKGTALSFNGTSSFVSFSSGVIPVGKKSIRFKVKTYGTSQARIMATSGGVVSGIIFTYRGDRAGKGVQVHFFSGTSRILLLESTKGIGDGNWHDVLFTWDGTLSPNSAKLYVDDMTTPDAVGTPTGTYSSNGYNLLIGKDASNALYFNGQLDEVEVYSDVIDPATTSLEKNKRFASIVRLMSGGINANDADNEWTKYIVNSDLNGTITPGDNNVWNWNGIWSQTSTTNTSGSVNRTVRGYSSVGGSSNISTSTTVNVNTGFRPVLLIEFLPSIKFEGSLDKTTIHNENVILSGTITEINNLDVQYRIEINGVQIYPETGYTSPQTPPLEISHEIANSYFRVGLNLIRLYVTNGSNETNFDFFVTLTNEVPIIETSMIGMKIDATITDDDNDDVQYNVYLNGKKIYPTDGDEYTEFITPPITFSKLFKENEIYIGQNNVLTINVRDIYGGENTVTVNFVGDYTGLMFVDGSGNYYSTNLGDIIKYLDFGDIYAGSTSHVMKVIIKNTNPNVLSNIRLKKMYDENVLNIEISKTNDPFIPESELNYNLVLAYGDTLEFYIRLTPNIEVVGEQYFELNVEADPVSIQ